VDIVQLVGGRAIDRPDADLGLGGEDQLGVHDGASHREEKQGRSAVHEQALWVTEVHQGGSGQEGDEMVPTEVLLRQHQQCPGELRPLCGPRPCTSVASWTVACADVSNGCGRTDLRQVYGVARWTTRFDGAAFHNVTQRATM
jgi:hypothetical protein